MKKLIVFMAVSALALSGCSKQEESDTTTVDPMPPPPMAPMAPAVTPPPSARQAMESTETDKSEEVATTAAAEAESAAAGMQAMAEQEATTASDDTMLSKGMSTASSLAGDIDWKNLSWDQVPNVPYEDKAQLAAWASTQVEEWKGKLGDAAKTKGLSMLSNLGDSGWQGAMKDVVAAIEGVRESNPETWDLARGALVSSWENFKSVATDYIDN